MMEGFSARRKPNTGVITIIISPHILPKFFTNSEQKEQSLGHGIQLWHDLLQWNRLCSEC